MKSLFCSPIDNVLGFSRETLVAVITNIEGRELRRLQNTLPEHPRASSTDDVECFFIMLRDSIGENFTTKEAKYAVRKVCLEFSMHTDPNYRSTTTHLVTLASMKAPFHDPVSKPHNVYAKLAQGDRPAAFTDRRAVSLSRHSGTISPTGAVHLLEHSYASSNSTSTPVYS